MREWTVEWSVHYHRTFPTQSEAQQFYAALKQDHAAKPDKISDPTLTAPKKRYRAEASNEIFPYNRAVGLLELTEVAIFEADDVDAALAFCQDRWPRQYPEGRVTITEIEEQA